MVVQVYLLKKENVIKLMALMSLLSLMLHVVLGTHTDSLK